GTAWSAGNDLWVSARHVVEDCERIRVAGSPWQPIAYVGRHPDADLATFRAGITRDPIALAAAVPQPGDRAFSVGFPQNQAGVAHLRLRGTERVKLAGRVASDRPFRALVWEVERYPRIRGEPERVGGLSGGPVIDRSGAAVGVAIFEAPRRHALGSVALSDVRRTLGPSRSPPQRAHIEPKEFDTQGRQLLERGTVVQVLCR
ncbi:MAG: trypsin-like peptidase domain-containing protein, partial [Alphaproteobacteria bacterium]|nr:trypsin-like peptidase domain-containing protein [Alphaproteobacteria bacterium]